MCWINLVYFHRKIAQVAGLLYLVYLVLEAGRRYDLFYRFVRSRDEWQLDFKNVLIHDLLHFPFGSGALGVLFIYLLDLVGIILQVDVRDDVRADLISVFIVFGRLHQQGHRQIVTRAKDGVVGPIYR